MGHLGGQDLDGPASSFTIKAASSIDFGGWIKRHYNKKE